jgi:hypothetical protein
MKVPISQGQADFVTAENGNAAYDTSAEIAAILAAAVAGVEVLIWEMDIPASEYIAWGAGEYGVAYNQSYMTFAAIDAGTAFMAGLLAFGIQDNSRFKLTPVKRIADVMLHSGTNTNLGTALITSKETATALPEDRNLGQPFSRLQLRYTAAAALAGCDQCNFAIPITRYFL